MGGSPGRRLAWFAVFAVLALVCVLSEGIPMDGERPQETMLLQGQADAQEPLQCHLKADADSKAQCCAAGLSGWLSEQTLYKIKVEADRAYLASSMADEGLKVARDAANSKYDESLTKRTYEEALRSCANSATAYVMPHDMAATVQRETAEEQAEQADGRVKEADDSAAAALDQQANSEEDFNRVDAVVSQDVAVANSARADKERDEAVLSEKQAALDTAKAALLEAKAALDAKETAATEAHSTLESAQKAGGELRSAQTAKVAEFDARSDAAVAAEKADYLQSSNADIEAADQAVTAASARVGSIRDAKERAMQLVDENERAVEEQEEGFRTAETNFAQSNMVLQTTTGLLDNAQTRRSVLENEVEDATTQARQTSLAQATLHAESLNAHARLDTAVKSEESAVSDKMQQSRRDAAAEWDRKYETLKTRLSSIDDNYESFKNCVQDGKWICDIPTE